MGPTKNKKIMISHKKFLILLFSPFLFKIFEQPQRVWVSKFYDWNIQIMFTFSR